VLFKILRLAFRQSRRLMPAVVLLSFAGAALEASALLMLPPLMAVLTNAPLAFTDWPLNVIGARMAALGPQRAVLTFAVIFAVLMTLRFVAIAWCLSVVSEIELRLVRHLRLRCLAVLFFAPQGFIDNYDNARIVQHFNEQSMRVGEILRTTLRSGTNLATFAFNLTVLFVLSPSLTVTVLLLLLGLSAAVSFIPRRIALNAKRFVTAVYGYNVRLGDLIAGIKTVRSYATFAREQRQVREVMEEQMGAHMKKVYFSGLTAPMFEALGFLTLSVILAASVFLISPSLWLAVLAPFVVILARTIPIASALNSVRSAVISNTPDYAAVSEFISHLPEGQTAEARLEAPFQRLELDAVSFGYRPDTPVIDRVSLTITRGERVLLVGPSGSGKTTILNLILGLYEPENGSIRVNGIDLRQLDREAWAHHVGVVEQSPFVFNDTVRANIAYRNEGVSTVAIYRALDAVGLRETVDAMPKKLDSTMGDAGAQISGGQRQRLAFARALCHEPDLLILDEPTSALDTATEAALISGVRAGYPEITIVAVSHSEAMHALFDRVVRLDAGKLQVVSS
jgi:ABC-type multidrug transport system fused ATPase/permease subunit